MNLLLLLLLLLLITTRLEKKIFEDLK